MKDLLLRAPVVVNGTSNMKIFTWSFGRLRQNIAPKSVPHMQHDVFLFVQPIKSLLCSVVVDVAVVKSKTPCYGHFVGVALYSPSILSHSFSHCLFLKHFVNVHLDFAHFQDGIVTSILPSEQKVYA